VTASALFVHRGVGVYVCRLSRRSQAGSTPLLRALRLFPHASVWGYLDSLEHPWKTMEGLVGTSARRGIPVWRWWAEKPRPQKSSGVWALTAPTATC
jgi:hypothetical protein